MNSNTADIHIERLDSLFCDILDRQNDVQYSLKKTKYELWGCYGEISDKSKHKKEDLRMWLKYCQEQMSMTLASLQQMADELDDIEEELNKDEVNNANE